MKKLFILFNFIGLLAVAQTKISPVSITAPGTLPANIADWNQIAQPIMATAVLQNGGPIQTSNIETKMLVSIISDGKPICNKYTKENAPFVKFSSRNLTITKSDILSSLNSECILKPGQYELCIQFLDLKNNVLGQSCKMFMVNDVKEQNTILPILISPVNNKELTEKDAKTPLIFRWTAISPKPKESVTYKLKVWQLRVGQKSSEAMRTNMPIFEKEVKDLTQVIVNSSVDFPPCRLPHMCDFIWNVQVLDINGKDMGSSEPSVFKIIVVDPSAGCFEIDTTSYKVECNGYGLDGKPKYKLTNLILKNIGSNPGRPGLFNNTSYPTNFITAMGGITISNILPSVSPIIPPGGTMNFSLDFTSTSGSTATIIINSTIPHPTNPSLYCDKTISITVDLPLCYCKDCEMAKIDFNNTTIKPSSSNPNIYNATGNLNVSGLPAVYAVEMQVLSYSFTAEPLSCSNGISNIEQSCVFNKIGTSINGIAVSMMNETVSGLPSTNNGIAKNIKISSTTPLPSSIPINLNIGLPGPLTGLTKDCCKMTHRICLKVRVFYDKDSCKSCSFTFCFPTFNN